MTMAAATAFAQQVRVPSHEAAERYAAMEKIDLTKHLPDINNRELKSFASDDAVVTAKDMLALARTFMGVRYRSGAKVPRDLTARDSHPTFSHNSATISCVRHATNTVATARRLTKCRCSPATLSFSPDAIQSQDAWVTSVLLLTATPSPARSRSFIQPARRVSLSTPLPTPTIQSGSSV